jgi:predicted enzyme related to lactoylglutathione lyase
MTSGMKTVVFPARDLAVAKELYTRLLGVAPHTDQPYYVGFSAGGQEIGLDPGGHAHGAVGYWHVDDIAGRLEQLLDAGAEEIEGIKDVGGGKLIATVRDPSGNLIGLLQES